MAKYQQDHIVDHPSGFKVSKFVTVRVEQQNDDPNNIGVECWMATDMAATLERDGVFGNSDKPDKLTIREGT